MINKTPLPLIAIDPSLRALGWAYVGTAGFLVAAGVARSAHEETAYAARELHTQLHAAWVGLPAAATLVVERMQVYKGPQQKGDPNDLIALSYVAGGIQSLPDIRPDAVLLTPTPHTWKGQVPKEIMLERIRTSLTELEVRLVDTSLLSVPAGLRHNGWDAAGLSAWALGRLRGSR